MTDRRDVTVEGVAASARAEAIPGRVEIVPGLRLTLLGVLVSIGLGVAGIIVSAGDEAWVASLAGVGSAAIAAAALHFTRTRSYLARFAQWVLPDDPPG